MEDAKYIRLLEEGALELSESFGLGNKENSLVRKPKSKKGKEKIEVGDDISKIVEDIMDDSEAIDETLDTENLDVDEIDKNSTDGHTIDDGLGDVRLDTAELNDMVDSEEQSVIDENCKDKTPDNPEKVTNDKVLEKDNTNKKKLVSHEFTEQEIIIFNKLMSEIDSIQDLSETSTECDKIEISGEIMSDEELKELDEQFGEIALDEDSELDSFILDVESELEELTPEEEA